MNWDLKDQAVLITGAGRGLGRSAARLLAQCGARVAVCDVDAASCTETAQLIGQAGGRAASYAFEGGVSREMSFMNRLGL